MLGKHDLFYVGRRIVFADDYWDGKHVEGLAESVEYLTRKKVYFSKKKKKEFYTRAIIRPGIEDIADKIIEQLSSQELLEVGVQKVKKKD